MRFRNASPRSGPRDTTAAPRRRGPGRASPRVAVTLLSDGRAGRPGGRSPMAGFVPKARVLTPLER
jgi:hypothetical protein